MEFANKGKMYLRIGITAAKFAPQYETDSYVFYMRKKQSNFGEKCATLAAVNMPTTGVPLAPWHDEFCGPRSDYVRQVPKACLSMQKHLQRKAEVGMSLRRFRRQYEQLSQFERIILMMEAGWPARRVWRVSAPT
ncbi:hypothetical protein TNCV_1101091 [Trichonephila clavipes]|nr:hypothetical protein TNCV_1101091 [Trichonephila clavipes]